MTNLLSESLKEHEKKAPKNLAELSAQQRRKVEDLLSPLLLPSEQERVYEQLRRFVTRDFGYQLAEKYSVISDEIFKLKRKAKVHYQDSYVNGDYLCEVPSIVEIPLQEENDGTFKVRAEAEGETNRRATILELSCPIPEIIPEARASYAEAKAYCAETTAKAYRDPLISRILLGINEKKQELRTPLDAEYSLVWAPSTWTADKIIIPEKDPAILMEYCGWRFLVHQWEIPKERSLDAVLREFNEKLV